jgi:hypothetical protein
MMFRHVTGAHDAIVHQQSNTRLEHEHDSIRFVKDTQSDRIARTYMQWQWQWFQQRQQLKDQLTSLTVHRANSQEIRHVKKLIEYLDVLIDNDDLSTQNRIGCDIQRDTILSISDDCILTRKPLGDKLIRLPRRLAKTSFDLSNLFSYDIDRHMFDEHVQTSVSNIISLVIVDSTDRTSSVVFHVNEISFEKTKKKKRRKKRIHQVHFRFRHTVQD